MIKFGFYCDICDKEMIRKTNTDCYAELQVGNIKQNVCIKLGDLCEECKEQIRVRGVTVIDFRLE